MIKLSFSGHETFTCKQYWLYKGYNFVKNGNRFNSDDAVVILGVGKNMVISIRYWMKSFGLLDDNDQLTEFANFIFDESGKDPFIEDIGTNWLLHYNLIKTNRASIYNLIFNEFRIERIEFTKNHLLGFIKRKCDEVSLNLYRETSVTKDINVFLRNYITFKDKKSQIDEDFSSMFYELNLVSQTKTISGIDDNIVDYFKIENKFRKDLHPYIFLFTILDNEYYSDSISFNDIYDNESKIFAINKENTLFILNFLANDKFLKSKINYTESAGIKALQFKNKPIKWDILRKYYSSTSHSYSFEDINRNYYLFN